MLRAIAASTGAAGTRMKPSVAAASVMLCASVKAVTVAKRLWIPRTSRGPGASYRDHPGGASRSCREDLSPLRTN